MQRVFEALSSAIRRKMLAYLAHSAPCGGCRQRLSEFAEPEAKIHLCDASGVTRTVTLADLLPAAFDAKLG